MRTIIEAAALLWYQRTHGFDIIGVHKTYAGYAATRIREWLQVPITITAHGGDVQKMASIGYGARLNPRRERKIAYAVQHADGQFLAQQGR